MPAKPKFYIGIKNEVSSNTLELYFTDYIYDGWDWSTFEPVNMVQDTIDKIKAANPSTIKIIINSLGGDVMIGLALYNYLKAYEAVKEVEIIGFAASIASIIAMCASSGKLRMATNSFMIIHAAWGYAAGNADEMREAADNLEKVTNELAEIYAARSGKHDAAYFKDLWKDGDHWLTGKEAIEIGLADELINAPVVNAHVDLSLYNFKHIPDSIKNASEDHKGFFSSIKSEFMKLIDTLKNAVTGAKSDNKTDNITNKQEILDLVQSVLTPFAEAIDEKLPDEEEEETTTGGADKGKTEEGKDGKKKEDKPADEKPKEESEEIKNLRNELQQLRESIAANASQPKNDKGGNSAQPVGEIEYEK